MKYELILVRYGEIALKGKETRNRFENILVNNIRNALNSKKILHKIKKERGRIYVSTDQIQDSIDILQKVFGIISVSPAVKINSDMDVMSKFAVKVAKENDLTRENSFALRVTRTGSHSFSSQDVAVKLGSDIVDATGAKVDLSNPFFELFIEVRNDDAFFFIDKIRCVGGMPFNTQGTVLCLVDSVSSILASWYLMRRGCKVFFLCVDESLCDVIDVFSSGWFVSLKKTVIDSEKENLYDAMSKICVDNICEAVVTGYVISDMSEINSLKNNCDLPVLHPLIAMEKEEINKKCGEVGLRL